MAKLTDEMLRQIMPNAPRGKRQAALPILNKVAFDYAIITPPRLRMWLATLAIESGELKYQEELASGDAYDTRTDLGNTPQRDGDGRLYKGHGRIQITGKANHAAYTEYLRTNKHLPFIDFVKYPHKLAQEPYATDAAGWFWAVYKKLNRFADKDDFLTTQKRVNGVNKKTGRPNHWKERVVYYNRAKRAIPDDFILDFGADSIPSAGKPINEQGAGEQSAGASSSLINNPRQEFEGESAPATSAAEQNTANANSAPAPSQDSNIGQIKETVSETIQHGETTIEKTVSEVKETFEPKSLPAFIPRLGKKWLLTLFPGFGFLSTIGSYFAGLPQWMVLLIGVLTGVALLAVIQFIIKHHEKVLEFITKCYEATADPTQHNLIPTPAAEFVGQRGEQIEKAVSE